MTIWPPANPSNFTKIAQEINRHIYFIFLIRPYHPSIYWGTLSYSNCGRNIRIPLMLRSGDHLPWILSTLLSMGESPRKSIETPIRCPEHNCAIDNVIGARLHSQNAPQTSGFRWCKSLRSLSLEFCPDNPSNYLKIDK